MNKGDVLEVQIESLAAGGMGLARHQSFVIFVPFSAPGDCLRVRLNKVKKSHGFADIEELLSPSPLRVTPPCPYFGRCGGCDWQHISYLEQLKTKQAIVANHLRHLWQEPVPITPSSREYRYRNRIQLKSRGGRIGYYAKGSHQLVEINDCLIAEENVAEQIPPLISDPPPDGTIELRAHLERVETRKLQEQESGEDFAQVNRFINPLLIEHVLGLLKGQQYKRVWDLYAGSGNFSFPIKRLLPEAEVIAVEGSTAAVHRAHEFNQDLGPEKQVQFYLSPVERFAERFDLGDQALILLDPPRTGCSPYLLASLRPLHPSKIIYISCNPATLARDLKDLLGPGLMKIAHVRAFDMFPQTSHVETVVELVST